MKPLVVLIVIFAITALICRVFTESWNLPLSGNAAMCAMLCFTAMGHFMFVKGMTLMIPDFVPYKKELVYLTGIAEIALGVALLFPATRHFAGVALIIFFCLILPANINAAMKNLDYEKGTYDGAGRGYLWFRVPLQIFFIAWVWYFSL